MKKKFAVSLFALFLLALPAVGYLAEYGTFVPSDISRIIEDAIGWFSTIATTIGIIMIIAAGVVWMTAGGNAERIGTARKMLIWGLIGIATAILAFSARFFLEVIISK